MTDVSRRSDDQLPTEENPIPFGRYQLVELVGEGAMAQVYRARQSGPMGFSKEVALKRLRKGALGRDRREIQALVNEARTGGQLRHPNVVEIYGCDVHDGAFFLAMEFVHGWLLDDVLWRILESDLEMPREAVVDILRQIARGLAYAHEATDETGQPLRLVHRDLKPQNVFLDRLGVVKIADFGLAKSTANLYRTTNNDETKGSPLYMSPEQIGGDTLDGRSDLFALGSIAVELVTGLRPFEGTSIPNTLMRVLEVEYAEAMEAFTSRAPELLPLLDRLLQQRPDDRYPSATELLKDLDALAGDVSIGAHTRALVGAVLGEDPPGVPESIKAPYADLSRALAAAGGLAADPTAHLRKAPGRAWGGAEPSSAQIAPPRTATLHAPASPRPVPPPTTSPVQQTQPVPQLRMESSVILPPQHRPRRRDGRRLLLMLALIAVTLAGVLGLMLWEGWDDFDEALIDRSELPGDLPLTPAHSVAPALTPPPRPAPTMTSGPAIHVPRASVRVWQDLPIVVQLLDDGTWTGRVHYRPAGSPDWRRTDLADQGDGRLEVSIPITQELGGAVEYWLELQRAGAPEPLLRGSTAEPYSVSIL